MPQTLSREELLACLNQPHQTAITSAGPIEYADRGNGEPLLAVHGTLGGWDQGLIATEYFRANGYRVIAPSRPGYCGTPLTSGKTSTEQADALAALLDWLGISETSVFAGSGGGPTAYALAARHPDKVTSLVQVDAACLPVPRLPLVRLFAMDFAIHFQLWLVRHAPGLLLKAMLRRFRDRSAADTTDGRASMEVDPLRIANLEALLTASRGWAVRRTGFDNDTRELTTLPPLDLQAIKCPVLIMHAAADATVPPENARFAHEQIPQSELYWMTGSHVAFFLEEADTAPLYALGWLQSKNEPGQPRETFRVSE